MAKFGNKIKQPWKKLEILTMMIAGVLHFWDWKDVVMKVITSRWVQVKWLSNYFRLRSYYSSYRLWRWLVYRRWLKQKSCFWAVAVLDIDIEQRTDRGLPSWKTTPFCLLVCHFTYPIYTIFIQESLIIYICMNYLKDQSQGYIKVLLGFYSIYLFLKIVQQFTVIDYFELNISLSSWCTPTL